MAQFSSARPKRSADRLALGDNVATLQYCAREIAEIARRMFAYYLHNLDPFIFRLWDNFGPRWYGMAYVLAFVCGYLLLLILLAKRGYARSPRSRQVGDFVTWAALFGVMVGGRLGYVLFYRPEMLRDPLSILRVWEGGMSSHGGMIGVVLFSLYLLPPAQDFLDESRR